MRPFVVAVLFAALLVTAAVFSHCAFGIRATGGYYDDNGFYPAGADPCAGHGGVTGPPTTGFDPLTGKWFDEYGCADGTTVRVDRGAGPGEEEANYEPSGDPPPPCVEAHYSDDPEKPWDEGTC